MWLPNDSRLWLLVASLIATASAECVCRQCEQMFAAKFQTINGNYNSADQLIQILDDSMTMLYNGKSIQQIVDYLKSTQDKYMTPAQIKNVTSIVNSMNDIFGNTNKTAEFLVSAVNMTVSFITNDLQNVNQTIHNLKANNTSLDEAKLVLCREVYQMYTAEKRNACIQKVFDELDPSKQAGIYNLLGQITNLADIKIHSTGATQKTAAAAGNHTG